MRLTPIITFLLYIDAAEDTENDILTHFIDECNDPRTTKSQIRKNIETLLTVQLIAEKNPDSKLFLRACENQTLKFCTQCASICLISQYCSAEGTARCRTNCISNHLDLVLSHECCSTYCNSECPLVTQIVVTDRVRRAVATQPSMTSHPTLSYLISESDGRMLLSGTITLFLILALIIMLLRLRKSHSDPCLSRQETDSTETDSTITDSTDSITPELMLLADKYEGKWDNSDDEVAENFPKAPLDAVLASNRCKCPLFTCKTYKSTR